MKIYNGTAHEISLYREEDCIYNEDIRKHVVKGGKSPFLTLKKEKPLNAKIIYSKINEIEGISIYKMKADGIDEIPDAEIVIVSNLFATIAKQLNLPGLEKLYTIANPVYDNINNPRPIGALGLLKVKQE